MHIPKRLCDKFVHCYAAHSEVVLLERFRLPGQLCELGTEVFTLLGGNLGCGGQRGDLVSDFLQQHGELGPVLREEGQHFRDAAEVARAA